MYELAVKYDLIIVEDDRELRRKASFLGEALAETMTLAYYFLQFEPYLAPTKSKTANGHASESVGQATPLDLIPSYIQLDTQGRVIRLETFSKVRNAYPCVAIFTNYTHSRQSRQACD